MYAIRILGAATAFCTVLLEVYSGVIDGPLWWVLPGGLVLALLISLSLYMEIAANGAAGRPTPGFVSSAIQFIVILAIAFGMSWFSNHFGREIIPQLLEQRGWTRPAP
ncbi:hypothetical protein SAMN06297382_1292 [Amphiplicatus metriothermophilus]|uniref:Uncharacterized protein n=2 Tax=Amphiplicatus metriothermophilus TaxID=1519374 RepID=A0A239PPM6_9PROT|nr:hypothetical protein [Amphiplicatus metriothermophilus]SNT72254.1 hypothetical protein SAMN06297382_1292 [Amphiplicatus metriothermophilus]